MADVKVFFSFSDARRYVKEGPFFLSWKGVLLPFWWRLNGSERAVIFVPGRTRREKPMPIFQRASYAKEIAANTICLFDPTLFQSKSITLGWFVGNRNHHYGDMYARVLPSLIKTIDVKADNTVLYGTSGGGIPALLIAKNLPGSFAYVSNIQTDIRRYDRRHYNAMLETCFPRMSENEVLDRFAQRLSVFNSDGPYHMICTQNRADEHHYDEHFLPFFNHRHERIQADDLFCNYDDPASGHDVLPRNTELEVLQSLLEKTFLPNLLPNGRIHHPAATSTFP